MNILFDVVDRVSKKIRLTDKQWSHITEDHPFMTNYIEQIKETLEKPDKITQSLVDEDVRYYYRYYKHKSGPYKYLMVIVKYLNGDGFVITAYFEDKIK